MGRRFRRLFWHAADLVRHAADLVRHAAHLVRHAADGSVVMIGSPPVERSAAPPTLAGLFAGFFSIGVRGFGGVLPWARRALVEERKWLTPAEFAEVLGLCQFLPGGNIVNVSIAVGSRFRGVAGAVAAVLGLMVAPVAIVVALGAVYDQFADLPSVRRAFAGLAAAGSAFVLTAALKIAAPLRTRYLALAIVAATFVATAVFRVPLYFGGPVLAVVSIFLLWRFER